jgi:bacterioferritin-associated ferredoxin
LEEGLGRWDEDVAEAVGVSGKTIEKGIQEFAATPPELRQSL